MFLRERERKEFQIEPKNKTQRNCYEGGFRKISDSFILEEQEENKKKTESERFAEFTERRRIIVAEEETKRIMNKVKLNMRADRAIANN